MDSDHRVTLNWHGAAHYHISYRQLKTVIDPLYTRLPGDKPHLDRTRDDLDRIDYLLLTHGHLDHSWDFPYLVARHGPAVYAPRECLGDVEREVKRSGAECDMQSCHALDEIKGKAFSISDIEVTPYQIGTEEIDFWFIRSMSLRPWLHSTPSAVPADTRCRLPDGWVGGESFVDLRPLGVERVLAHRVVDVLLLLTVLLNMHQ